METDFTCLARAWVTAFVQTLGRTKGFTFYQKVNIAFNRAPSAPHDDQVDQSSVKNDAHKIYQGLNDNNDFKNCEAYKILARKLRWANLKDDELNHAGNVPRNVARRTSKNSSLGNSVGSNNLSEAPDSPPTPQSAGQNSELDGSLYEGGSRPIGQKHFIRILQHKKHWMVLLHLVAVSK
ncbi:hypothetical protein GIB67_041312 [Kingdonia uniflora]|uniref:Uncharacterized protein n=1 Tax=Kingdonia uniflora TaxID=39325 RepID=A0A7J7NIQ8_9MAGN|nr:hypothetical protein GIB67_036267 [Kingdonia uniflora]KAF6167057.1 hypothetical protein GIB67_041312 [Kingdonia uniflora]